MAGRIAISLTILALFAPVARAQDEVVPPPPPAGPSPAELVVAPLLNAAEQDLAENRVPLALARTTAVAELLPEGVPLRVRADGLRLLAQQRTPTELAPPPPPIDEVYS